ncbi:hypothetical protein [Aminobacter sp. HY435]|uniref:hypothetical protein n=1 Tax=Aminobacter sp. HY435 TaxID=2970917 RepID=UPI0022B961F4|nr:hypothetical protein [Aminobacter sp. HY435]
MRLIALLLTWALVLLPQSLEGPSPEQRDWRAGQGVADIGNPQPLLSSHDRNQSALRSSETKHSGKSTGGWGKAALAVVAQLILHEPGQAAAVGPDRAAAPKQRFVAFSARAPPLPA